MVLSLCGERVIQLSTALEECTRLFLAVASAVAVLSTASLNHHVHYSIGRCDNVVIINGIINKSLLQLLLVALGNDAHQERDRVTVAQNPRRARAPAAAAATHAAAVRALVRPYPVQHRARRTGHRSPSIGHRAPGTGHPPGIAD